jgi:hypothetical protein
MKTMFWDEGAQNDLLSEADKILYKLLEPAVIKTYQLLNETAFNNAYTCYHISLLKDELIELIKIGSSSREVSIPTLLSEVYRVIEPDLESPELFFKSWIDRFETITEANYEE